MFLCCQNYQNGDDAFQMFQTPRQLSLVSHPEENHHGDHRTLRGILVNNITKTGKQPHLKATLNYVHTQIDEFADYALKKIKKSNYEQIKKQLAKSNKKWTDPDFPPEQRSYGTGRDYPKVNWKRLEDIVKKPVFIDQCVSPSDIMQGAIGNCYFLSAIAGLAQKPSRITNLFGELQINKNGIYMARVLYGGVFKEIVIDDYFPVDRLTGRPIGAQPAGGNECWVMILEKIWAKMFGSYENIDGGLPNEVLHAFSHAPIFQYGTMGSQEDLDELFFKILQSSKLEQVICCGTNSDVDVQQMGLVSGHAYTILDAYDKPCRLLKVRNPWGQVQWKGTACDADKDFWRKMSVTEKKRLGYQQKDDGIFFIVWQDFLQFFQIVNICKVNDRASYYYEELTYPKGEGIFTSVNCKGGQTTFALTQLMTRGSDVPEPRYATSSMLIAKDCGEGKYEYVGSLTQRNTCDSNLELQNLKQGQYIVYSTLIGRKMKQDATLSCYSESPCQLDAVTDINQQDFLHQIFLAIARKNKQNQQRIYGNMDVWVCMDIDYNSGYAYTVVHVGKQVNMKLSLHFNEDEYIDNNFELMPPFRDQGSFNITVGRGQDSIVLCRIVPCMWAVEAALPIPNIKRIS